MKLWEMYHILHDPTDDTLSFNQLFQKVLNDEISAAVLYQRLANEVIGYQYTEFREQMLEHAADEYRHFNDLLLIASNRGIEYTVALTPDATVPIEGVLTEKLIALTQTLETNAIEDYRMLAETTFGMKEYELHKKFKELLTEETEHFDDVAVLTGEIRPL
jgi:ferritin